MNKIISLIAVSLFLAKALAAQITFEKSYNTFRPGSADVVFCQDNGYLFAVVSGNSPYYLGLVKTDFYGDTLWTKRFDFEAGSNWLAGSADESGNIYLSFPAIFISLPAENNIIKLDKNGNIIWSKRYNGLMLELQVNNNDLWCLADGPKLYRIDASSGDSLWASDYIELDNRQYWIFNSSITAADNGDVIFTTTITYDGPAEKTLFFRKPANADTVIEITPATDHRLAVYDSKNYGNNIVSIARETYSYNSYFFMMYNTNGSLLTYKHLDLRQFTDSRLYKFTFNSENNVVAAGYAETQLYNNELLLHCWSLSGDSLWTRIIHSNSIGYDIKLTNDNGFIISGENSNNTPVLIKTTAQGSLNAIDENAHQQLAAYTDPASGNVIFNLPGSHSGMITIMNTTGEVCAQFPVTGGHTECNTSNIKPGVYFYSVITDKEISSGKLICK